MHGSSTSQACGSFQRSVRAVTLWLASIVERVARGREVFVLRSLYRARNGEVSMGGLGYSAMQMYVVHDGLFVCHSAPASFRFYSRDSAFIREECAAAENLGKRARPKRMNVRFRLSTLTDVRFLVSSFFSCSCAEHEPFTSILIYV